MAIANLETAKEITGFNEIVPTALTAFNAAAGAEYVVTGSDENMMMLVVNADASNAEDLTIKAPTNKMWSSALADKVVSIPASEVAILKLESAKYMDPVTKKISFAGTADVKAAVFVF